MRVLTPIFIFGAIAVLGQNLAAQAWKTSGLDTFAVQADQTVYLAAAEKYGIAFRLQTPPVFPNRFWIQADIWFEHSPAKSELWFVFGTDSADTTCLWAAGYSLRDKEIRFARLYQRAGGEIQYKILTRKPLEIIDFRKQYVYRILFMHDTNQFRVEVNGVPMLVFLPVPTGSLKYFGYMQKGWPLRVGLLQFAGE